MALSVSGFQVASFQQSPGNLALYKSIEMDCCLRTAKRQMCFPGMLPQRDVLRPQPAIEFRDRTCFFAHQGCDLGKALLGPQKKHHLSLYENIRKHITHKSSHDITCHHNGKHRGHRRYPLKMLKRTHCISLLLITAATAGTVRAKAYRSRVLNSCARQADQKYSSSILMFCNNLQQLGLGDYNNENYK